MKVKIIGAGLAGSEATWQIAKRGIAVDLYEMRPKKMTKAHKTGQMAELVCSNSFRGACLSNAVGLLKEELKLFDSLIMSCALATEVPAGGALAVDRELFSRMVDEKVRSLANVRVLEGEIESVPTASTAEPVIIATGPLTSPALALSIRELCGEAELQFYDAISPILLKESIDMSVVFRQSRYDKGGDDYLNIPLSQAEYDSFISDVAAAELYGGKEEVESDCIENLKPFEGCMPLEEMISRGHDTPRFGPMKPVGLTDPRDGSQPHAVIQLRMDDRAGLRWSMVGLQTKMKRGEQEKILRKLPGLAKAEFIRYGSVHRNSFINSPNCLSQDLVFKAKPGLLFAGQITGVEGYVESTASGLVAGINAANLLLKKDFIQFDANTAIGSLLHYISDPERKEFQPMNVSFGLMPEYLASKRRGEKRRERRLRAAKTARRNQL